MLEDVQTIIKVGSVFYDLASGAKNIAETKNFVVGVFQDLKKGQLPDLASQDDIFELVKTLAQNQQTMGEAFKDIQVMLEKQHYYLANAGILQSTQEKSPLNLKVVQHILGSLAAPKNCEIITDIHPISSDQHLQLLKQVRWSSKEAQQVSGIILKPKKDEFLIECHRPSDNILCQSIIKREILESYGLCYQPYYHRLNAQDVRHFNLISAEKPAVSRFNLKSMAKPTVSPSKIPQNQKQITKAKTLQEMNEDIDRRISSRYVALPRNAVLTAPPSVQLVSLINPNPPRRVGTCKDRACPVSTF